MMNKNFLVLIALSLSIVATLYYIDYRKNNKKGGGRYIGQFVEKMPIVRQDPFAHLAYGSSPIEQREDQYRRWLSASVKITTKSGSSGSGTIVYFNSQNSDAYVISCGHLFKDNMSSSEGMKKKIDCTIKAWYHNRDKLSSPKEHQGRVIYYSNRRGEDCSLMIFRPDWEPEFFPIASEDFHFVKGMRLHSCGCDGGTEVAHYDVRYLGSDNEQDVVTTENSPRPGRSGGGLMTDVFLVGICWGTSVSDGSGNGYFTPFTAIRKLNKENGYGWLNDIGIDLARQIPVIDHNNKQKNYPRDYIPLPQNH